MLDHVRMTMAVAQLLRVFYEDPGADWYGYDLIRETGFKSGKIYPILARLTKAGWLARTEPDSNTKSGGPPRVTYRLTPEAVPTVARELELIDRSFRLPKSGFRPSFRPQRT